MDDTLQTGRTPGSAVMLQHNLHVQPAKCPAAAAGLARGDGCDRGAPGGGAPQRAVPPPQGPDGPPGAMPHPNAAQTVMSGCMRWQRRQQCWHTRLQQPDDV
jgi:hypothetical protein